MTNEQRVDRLERYLIADRGKTYTTVRVNDLDTVLSLIKGNQIETEIYKEELDSIYKALDIERGVARPRTDEIIRALKNTIKSQAKQIDLMAKAFKQDDARTVEEIKQYFAELAEKE